MNWNELKLPDKNVYFKDDAVIIYCADCRDILPRIPDKSIDLVLTDPPYGVNADKGVGGFGVSKTDKHYDDNWDSQRPDKTTFNEILRVSKNALIFGGNFFADILPLGTHWIVWDKKGDIKFQNPYSDCELLWTNFSKNTIKKYTFRQQGFITDSKDTREHPTQKPSELFELLIRDYGGDLILDPFLGSGTTAYCDKKLGRKCIGIEIEEKYCEIAKKRLSQSVMNLTI